MKVSQSPRGGGFCVFDLLGAGQKRKSDLACYLFCAARKVATRYTAPVGSMRVRGAGGTSDTQKDHARYFWRSHKNIDMVYCPRRGVAFTQKDVAIIGTLRSLCFLCSILPRYKWRHILKYALEFDVTVDRTKSGFVALEGLERELIVNKQVLETMPVGVGDEVKLLLSLPSQVTLSNAEVCQELTWYKRVSADPYTLLAFNRQHPQFADDYPHWTQWKNAAGIWCVMVFNIGLISRKRELRIAKNDYGWNHAGLLAGVHP